MTIGTGWRGALRAQSRCDAPTVYVRVLDLRAALARIKTLEAAERALDELSAHGIENWSGYAAALKVLEEGDNLSKPDPEAAATLR